MYYEVIYYLLCPGPLTPNNSMGGSCGGVSVSPGPGHDSAPAPGSVSPGAQQCHAPMGGPGEAEVWRSASSSSIASLRRRAFEHSGISMSVFR